MTAIETEVKFTIPNRSVLDELRQLQQLDDFQLRPGEVKDITDRYLDTADQDIYRAGYACRIRSGKTGLHLTLKSLTTPDSTIHRRQEIEMDIPSEHITDWPAGQAKDMVVTLAGDEPLQTLFTLRQIRHKYHAWLEHREVFELSLDIVTSGDSENAEYFELEAELLAGGNEADLLAFVKALQRRWWLQPQPLSKFERAFEAYRLHKRIT